MKRTTIILFCILGAALLISLRSILVTPLNNKSKDNSLSGITSDQEEQTFHNVRHINFSTRAPQVKEDLWIEGNINVLQATEEEQCKIRYPKSQYMKVYVSNDTLFAILDLTKYQLSKKEQRRGKLSIDNFYISLVADKALESITSGMRRVNMFVDGFQSDSLHIHSLNQNLTVSSCQFQALNITGTHINTKLNKCIIGNYHLDLQNTSEWDVSAGSQVNTLFLYGATNKANKLEKNIFKRVVWDPKGGPSLMLQVSDKIDMKLSPRDIGS